MWIELLLLLLIFNVSFKPLHEPGPQDPSWRRAPPAHLGWFCSGTQLSHSGKLSPMQRPCGHTKLGFLGENQAWYMRRSVVHPPRTAWSHWFWAARVDKWKTQPLLNGIKQPAMLDTGASVGVGARERGGPFYLPEWPGNIMTIVLLLAVGLK